MKESVLPARNYHAHIWEGGLYLGGMAFVSAETVLPRIVEQLGATPLIISMMPTLLILGFMSPGVLVVPLLERLPRYYPFVMLAGFLQRLPYLLAGLALWFLGNEQLSLCLAIVVLAPLLTGIIGGVPNIAWMEMVTRMVPEKKRASAWAWRWVIAAVIGIAAGRFIYFVIEQYSMTRAYALMHLATFAFMMVSYGVMFFLREVDHPQRNRALPYRKAWGKYRQVWTENAKFRRYLWVKISGLGLFLMAPYLTITALEEKGRAESSMGSLVMAQMAGGIAGNLLAAQLGDRWGGRSISVAARVLCMLLCLFLLINSSYIGYLLALFFFGVVYYLFAVGELTLGVELLPREGRPYFMALQNLSMVPGILAINAMTYFLWRCSESFSVLVLATLLLSLLSLFLLRSLPEPRQKA